MSIKIYNGFKVEGMKTLDEYQEFSSFIREKLQQAARQIWVETIIRYTYELYDMTYIKEKKGYNFYNSVTTDFINRLYDALKSNQKDFLDMSVKLSLGVNNKQVYGIYYIVNRDLEDLFLSLDNIKEYCYYDNSDRPDGISVSEWNKRKKTWKTILGDYFLPSKEMLSIDIIPDGPIYLNKADFVNESSILSLKTRIKRCVEKMIEDKYFSNTKNDHNVWEHIRGFDNFQKTKDYSNMVDELTPMVESAIDKEITLEKMLKLPTKD